MTYSPTIQRCPHDKENPYAQISRQLIRDESISFECRGLLIYLLSMKDGWRINTKQLISHVKPTTGRDKVYSVIKEACDAGYMFKEEYKENNLLRVRYLVSEFPKFKKCFPHPDFPEAGNQDAEKAYHKEELSESGNIGSLGSSPFPSSDVKEDEPNRSDPKNNKYSDRFGSDHSFSNSAQDEEKKIPSLEEIEMILDHAEQKSEGKIKIKHSDIRIWVKKYGLEKTIQAVDLAVQDIRSGSLMINPGGWITNALKNYVNIC